MKTQISDHEYLNSVRHALLEMAAERRDKAGDLNPSEAEVKLVRTMQYEDRLRNLAAIKQQIFMGGFGL